MASCKIGLILFAVLCFLENTTGTSMPNFYCIPATNNFLNLSSGWTSRIATRTMADGETKYSDNIYCSWTIHSGSVNKRVVVSVSNVDIGTVPANAECDDYTYVAVKTEDITDDFNWQNADAGIYYEMCGSLNPKQFTSPYSHLIIEFHAKENTGNYKGIEFIANTFDKGTCLTGQNNGERNGYCYQIFDSLVTWVEAQKICTMQQGNLVSFEDQMEADFVKNLVVNNTTIMPGTSVTWSVGLHNMNGQSTFAWVDQINSTYSLPNQLSNVTSDSSNSNKCVVMNMAGTIQTVSCTDSTYKFICKSQKDGNSRLFKVTGDQPSSASNVVSFLATTFIAIIISAILLL